MKVCILTLGCKVNQSESAVIEGNLKKSGCSSVKLSENPDYCIINSCTVTAKSDYQSRQLIRRAVRSGAKVIVTGCYSQVMTDDIRKIDGIFDIIDSSNKLSIINIITDNISGITLNYSNRARPYLKVQDGCNSSCSYCIVPRARGRSRSLEVSEIIKQAGLFEELGYNEIVLTGIHLGSYGHDLTPKVNLSFLLKSLLLQTKIHRFRLSSIEVNEVDGDITDLLREERVCKHIHIPLQSGDDTILRLMNRMYTSKRYACVLEKILDKVPDIAIGTDLMVGFPEEGEKEFLNTKNFVDSLPISYIHIFPYSARPGTLACEMRMQNSPRVKKERLNIMRSINTRKRRTYISSQVNKTLDVIIEEWREDGRWVGTSSNYVKVEAPSKGHCRGDHVYVRVSGVLGDVLKGDVVQRL